MPLVVDPNIAAIIRYGKKHPQYDRAVRIYEQQKYEYDVAQNREHSQAVARAELQRRALSGEIDDKQPFFWSKGEAAAMAPILAKRKAEEKQAIEQKRKDNPYRYAPDVENKDEYSTDNTNKILRMQTDPVTREKLLKQERDRIAKADYIDSLNDPYNKVQSELQKDAQAKRDAAAAEIAKEYMESPSTYETNYGKDASIAAGKIARSYMDQKLGKVGYNGVPLGGMIFDPNNKMGSQGTTTDQTAGQTQGAAASVPSTASRPTTAATSSSRNASDLFKGGTSKLDRVINYVASPSASSSSPTSGTSASQPSTPATPQGPTYDPSKKYDHIKHAQWFDTLPEAEQERQLATMDDFQKKFLRESLAAVKKYEPAYKAVEDAKNSGPSMWGVAADNIGQTYRAIKGDVADIPQNMAKSLWGDKKPYELAAQEVQSAVNPQRSNEPSPDWKPITDAVSGPLRKAYDVTSQFVNGPTAPVFNALSKPLVRGVSKAFDWAGDPYGLAGREDSTPQAEQPVPQQEDEKDPAVIARRLLNTPSAQH